MLYQASDVRRWQAKLMSSPNNYSQTYLKKINTELNSIINYAKRFYDLNTNPCGKAGTIGKAKAEEMDYWTYDEYIAFREGVKDKPLSYICFEVLYWTGTQKLMQGVFAKNHSFFVASTPAPVRQRVSHHQFPAVPCDFQSCLNTHLTTQNNRYQNTC